MNIDAQMGLQPFLYYMTFCNVFRSVVNNEGKKFLNLNCEALWIIVKKCEKWLRKYYYKFIQESL